MMMEILTECPKGKTNKDRSRKKEVTLGLLKH